MSKPHSVDADEKFLVWLVESRSRNQQATLRTLSLGRQYRAEISASKRYVDAFDRLASCGFSLWRAVFLTDGVDTDLDTHFGQIDAFLQNLVHNNTVAYSQDRDARSWSFRYYVGNARFRMLRLVESTEPDALKLLEWLGDPDDDMNAQRWWELHQDALDLANLRFEEILKQERASKTKK